MNSTEKLYLKNIVAVAIVIIFVLTFFYFSFGGVNLTKTLGRIFPLPIAIVNGSIITSQDFDSGEPADLEVLDSLIKDKLFFQIIRDNRIAVNDEILNQYQNYLDNSNIGNKLYKENGVKPIELIVRIWYQNQQIDSPLWERAETARLSVEQGQLFAGVAKIYSDEVESKFLGGEIGFFSINDLSPWVVDQVSELSLNDISSVISSPEGFELYTIFNKVNSDSQEKFQLGKILIRDNGFDDFWRNFTSDAKISIFQKWYNQKRD